jgi:ribosomal protein S18 acetylase RimI-like enzyme
MSEPLLSEVDAVEGNAAGHERRQDRVASVTLRPVEPDDEPFLYQLYCSTRAEEIAAFGWDAAQQDAFLQLQFRGQQRHYQVQQLDVDSRVILQGARPIGQFIVMRSDREIRLADIALLPQYRSTGIGTELIGDLFAEARASGRPVTLHVEKSSRAVRFYERLGFVRTDETGFHYKMEWQPEVLAG